MRCAVLLITASCESAGDPPIPPQLVNIQSNGEGFEVVVDNTIVEEGFLRYAMRFSGGPVKMPDRFSIGTENNILGIGSCNTESQIGVSVHPAVVATANSEAVAPTSTIAVVLDHPGVASVVVDYAVPYLCPEPQILRGQSQFTFFASGRIVRVDTEVVPAQMPLMLPTNTQECGCLNPQSSTNRFFFTSYWAFAPQEPDAVDANGNEAGNGLDAACTIGPNFVVGVQWPEGSTNTRIGPTGASAHVFDFVSNGSAVPTTPRSVISRVQIDGAMMQRPPSFCGSLLEQLVEHELLIGEVGQTPVADTGIYRDNSVHSESFDLVAANGTIPGGFAVSLNLSGSQHARFTPDTEFTTPPIIKEDPVREVGEAEGDRFLIYFPDPLPAGERITIEPL